MTSPSKSVYNFICHTSSEINNRNLGRLRSNPSFRNKISEFPEYSLVICYRDKRIGCMCFAFLLFIYSFLSSFFPAFFFYLAMPYFSLHILDFNCLCMSAFGVTEFQIYTGLRGNMSQVIIVTNKKIIIIRDFLIFFS